MSRVLTLVFTDLADSVGLKRRLGDASAARLIGEHTARVRALSFAAGGREIFAAGDGFFLTFDAPSAAVEFALQLQLAHLATPEVPRVRVGIHMGEVTENRLMQGSWKKLTVEGLAVDLAARIQSLALPGQILLTYPVFDNARQRLQTEQLGQEIAWRAHGRYAFKSIEGALDIFEVGFEGSSPLSAPIGNDKARPESGTGDTPFLGWRPAQGQEIPARPNWLLSDKIGAGNFGEVWLARHRKTHERRVFKFCFSPDRLRMLKREVALFRMLRDSLGDRSDIARVLDYQFDHAPYFLELEYAGIGNLAEWAELKGGLSKVALDLRLQVVAKIADALAAAHGAGILHKDVKPTNILILSDAPDAVQIRMIDFGIGAIASREFLEQRGISAELINDLLRSGDQASGSGAQLYVAPEILEGRPATVWADIYSLGVILYQIAVGDLSRALAPGWEREVSDELLQSDINSCVDGNPYNRLTSVRELASRLRTRDQRLAKRERRRQQELAHERAERRHQYYRTGGLVGIILLVASLFIGLLESRRADEEERLRHLAQSARAEAVRQRGMAEAAQQAAEKAQYGAAIGLAAATVREGRTEKAREVLVDHIPEQLRGLEWGWLYAQTCPETIALNKVNAYDAVFSPDGKLFATGDRDTQTSGTGWLTIYDAHSGRRLRGAQIHNQLIWSLRFSPDGKYIGTAASDRTGAIVETDTLKVVARLKGHTGILRAIAFSPDGKQVATAGRDATIRIWNPMTGQQIGEMRMPGEQFCDLLWTPSGKSLISTALGGSTRLWDISSRQPRVLYTGPTEGVLSACFGLDDQTLITCSKDSNLRVYLLNEDVSTSEVAPLKKFPVLDSWPQAVSYARGSRLILAACDDGRVRAYDYDSGQLKFDFQSDEPAWKIDASNDGERALLTSRWSVRLVDLDRFTHGSQISPGTHPLPNQGIQRVLANGSAGTRDTSWQVDRVWRVPGGRSIATLGNYQCAIDSFQAISSPDDSQRICVDDKTLSACVVRNSDATTVAQLGSMAVGEAKFSPDGTVAALAGMFSTAEIWDAKSWKLIRKLDRGSDYCCCEQFSPDGKQLAIGYADGSILLWDASTGARIRTLAGASYRSLCLAFSPNGKYLASGHASDRAKLWDLKTGDQITTFIGHVRYVHDISFSPDSSRLMTVARDGTAKLWDPETGQELLNVFDTGMKYDLVCAFFCNDGQHIGALTSDRRLLLSEYFPWEPKSLPGNETYSLFQRLEIWKRQHRISPDITPQDVETR